MYIIYTHLAETVPRSLEYQDNLYRQVSQGTGLRYGRRNAVEFPFPSLFGTIRGPQVLNSWKHLLRHLVVWMEYGVMAAGRYGPLAGKSKDGCGWSFFGVRSRTQPGGISGALEGARVAELKPICKLSFLTEA